MKVAMNGAETTAGSTFIFFNTIGMIEETIALHIVMATMVANHNSHSWPTPKIHARINAAPPMVTATKNEVETSFFSTVPRLRKLTSPSAIARTNIDVICVSTITACTNQQRNEKR